MADDNKDKAAETPTRKRSKGTGGLQLEKIGIWTLRCTINGKRIAKSTAAQRLGGWGDNGTAAAPQPSAANRRQRNQWIGKVIRCWCAKHKSALLEGTAKLVANGGYRFLQELWERGVPMTNEDAIDALEVYLQAKQSR